MQLLGSVWTGSMWLSYHVDGSCLVMCKAANPLDIKNAAVIGRYEDASQALENGKRCLQNCLTSYTMDGKVIGKSDVRSLHTIINDCNKRNPLHEYISEGPSFPGTPPGPRLLLKTSGS